MKRAFRGGNSDRRLGRSNYLYDLTIKQFHCWLSSCSCLEYILSKLTFSFSTRESRNETKTIFVLCKKTNGTKCFSGIESTCFQQTVWVQPFTAKARVRETERPPPFHFFGNVELETNGCRTRQSASQLDSAHFGWVRLIRLASTHCKPV